ncbi:hypothetical protein QJS04_geneDACA000442 [Acorus gramineus]|uniref:BEACH domain-containing protein C2 n=1 Tax=Acorus gramineus TaxID=55184 RepID=A0AAV9AQA2_ACOGR|nr:hypothetical protein QJS04_geneDACA000442 [Acorus gramineus]
MEDPDGEGSSSATMNPEQPLKSDLEDEEDDLFEVSLGDQDRPPTNADDDHVRSSNLSDDLSRSSANERLSAEMDAAAAQPFSPDTADPGSSPSDSAIHTSWSAASLDSFSSSVGSPPKPVKPMPPMLEVSPEIVHLVDSAIMGSGEGMERLRSAVVDDEGVSVSVVDALLATMGGGAEEVATGGPPTVMLNSRAAAVAADLLPSLPFESRTRMVNGLLFILKACTHNRSMCSSSGLLAAFLRSAEKIFMSSDPVAWDGIPLCRCIQVLAGHSLSVADLHSWLCLITKALPSVWSSRLMLSLEKAVGGQEARGPACTFEFDGESSGLLGPGESRWPFSNGYAFATWIYIESFADTLNTATAAAAIAAAAAAVSGKSSAMSAAAAASALAGEGTTHMPRLFSFLSADNQGIEAYFHGQFLVVESGSGRGRKASLHFTYAFKPQVWYFIGLEHTCKQSLIGKAESELRLYVDGNLYESRPFEFPRISKSLAFCCIGTNPPPTIAGLQRRRRQCPLFAEMGPVYVFKEPIGPERMGRLALRGGDALPSFGSGAGSPWMATNEHVRSLAEESWRLDSEIAGSLHLLYHPNLLRGRFCPDASPAGAAGIHRRPAEVLGQVHVAGRVRPVESLWALAHGGPMALLPLAVSDVQNDSLEPRASDLALSLATTSISAPIFRIISLANQHPGNNEELCRTRGPEVLSRILHYLLEIQSRLDPGKKNGVSDEELVAAIVSLCQSPKNNHSLKVQLFSTLLLDLKMWSLCNYGLQKKLLSTLADMVFTESSAMRDANAMQVLLDGCRRCYWVIREKDSVDKFSLHEAPRPVGEVNALVDELLVVIELLVGAAPPTLAAEDVRCLIGFLVDCPQPNQVARVLHLIYRLVVQPNTLRAQMFAQSFISSGGIEALLVLLQREAKAGNHNVLEIASNKSSQTASTLESSMKTISSEDGNSEPHEEKETMSEEEGSQFLSSNIINTLAPVSLTTNIERTPSSSENQLLRNVGGISFSISAESARNNIHNVDDGDGIIVGIISLLGALVTSGHLKLGSNAIASPLSSNILGTGLTEEGGTMFEDKISLLLFALQKAFQAAPQRLMTANVYTTLLGAAINASSTDDGLNIYDSGHRFEHIQLLLVLLRSLPHASRAFQVRAIQDLLFLACSHPENRSSLTSMEEWPEWILEVLISNYEIGSSKLSNGVGIGDIEDLIHNFLIIILEHSMRQKDGWKDVEATIHCAEWLSMVGGSSVGDQRIRREESLPVFKRRLLGDLLDFAARELQVQQTQVIAAAAAGVAAEGLSPEHAKAEAENAAQLSVALAENAIVILMIVEDHLRLQSQLYSASHSLGDTESPSNVTLSSVSRSNSIGTTSGETSEAVGLKQLSLSGDSGGLSLDVLASMADANGQISAAIMERLTAAAAAEPYESVRCAFASYGSCALDLAEGWKYRSRMWYGVGLPLKNMIFSGGGSGWESWDSALEKDPNGCWIELPLVKKSIAMLQALLLDESGLGGGLGIGGGSGTGMGGMTALYQLLDSDQPFLCMLRMVLASMREEDRGENDIFMRNLSANDGISETLHWPAGSTLSIDENNLLSSRRHRSTLLWSVLAPVLNMPISESKRQRVLVASCILYAEVWHAVGRDRKPHRKQYLEAILPPFVAILRRWRPLLAGIHELTSSEGLNPLIVDDRALAADALPLEAALSMISPGWAAAFASPPAAMALAMIAAGAGGSETAAPTKNTPLRHDGSFLERKKARLYNFASFQKLPDKPNKSPPVPKDKAAAKAAALAAARDLERNAKIGSGRGLSAVAMATSAQRRSLSDLERAKRWNVSEAMGAAWMECLQSSDTKWVSGKDFSALSYKYVAVLVASFALARNMQRSEMDRRSQVDVIDKHRMFIGTHGWRNLIHCLVEMTGLFSPFASRLCNPERVFWKLDTMECSSRMRRYMKRNYRGSDHFGAAADYESQHKPDRSAVAVDANDQEDSLASSLPSTASILVAEPMSVEEVAEDDEQTGTDISNSIGDNQRQLPVQAEQPVQGTLDSGDTEILVDRNLVQTASAAAPGFVPSESDERIILELSSLMVRPLKVIRGTFQVTTKRLNFRIEDCLDESSVDGLDSSSQKKNEEKDRSWLLASLHQIFSRRYLLRRSALELFMVDRSNFFFDFGSIEGRHNAYRAIVQARPPHLNNMYLATQRPEQLKRTQLMERWARWEISNFEYLMELNTLAGRSYNDITQPVGALNPDRLKKFQERYSSFDDPVIPKFHYGSHYSSAGTVPELFYLPEVLINENSIDFGTTQLGGKLDSVKLPPWADNPIDFVHKHRMALESEHVSAHLHEWIDLIFGYKQRGKEAIAASNVFFYITYEGAVDIDKITDPVQQRATQDQIAYFGQTPSQLLTIPHLKKRPIAEVLHLQHGKSASGSTGGAFLRMFKGPTGSGSEEWHFPRALAFAASGIRSSAVVAVTCDKEIITGGHADNSVKLISVDGAKTIETVAGHNANVTCLALSPCSNYLVTGSRDTTVIVWRVHRASSSLPRIASDPSTSSATTPTSPLSSHRRPNNSPEPIRRRHIEGPMHVLRGHLSEVLCCCVSSDLGIVASCSHASGVLLHSLRKGRMIRKLAMLKADLVCLSPQGVVMTWNKLERRLDTFTINGVPIATAVLSPSLGSISCIEVSLDGQSVLIGTSSNFINNSKEIKSDDGARLEMDKPESEEHLSLPNEDHTNRLLVSVPSICFIDLHTLKIFHKLEFEEGQDITTIALNRDNTNLLVSTADKKLTIFTDPNLSLKVVDQMLRLGWEGDGLSPLVK